MLEKFFKLRENGTKVQTEVLAGLITFMTMAYILAVNPDILAVSGMPRGGIFVATVLAATVGSILMGFLSNYPFALAPGLGINAFFSYTVVVGMGYSWQFALLAVFVEGLIFLALSVTSVREKILNSVPTTLKAASAVGIGLFIAFIALQNGKVIVTNDATYLGIVNFHKVDIHTEGVWALLTISGIILTSTMLIKGLKGAMLFGIFGTWLLGILAELAGLYVPNADTGFYSVIPDFSHYTGDLSIAFREFGITCGALFQVDAWTHTVDGDVVGQGFSLIKSLDFFVVIFAFFFVDMFDTLGTLIGVSVKGGFLTKEGRLPRASRALSADAIATSAGAIFGTSTTTTFIESAAGVAIGGHTGLTAVSAGVLFLSSIMFAPVFLSIPSFATTPALFLVGFFMMASITKIDFNKMREAIPAFVCIMLMPLTYSVSNGIMIGIISYTFIHALIGRIKEVHWLMIVLSFVFILKYTLI